MILIQHQVRVNGQTERVCAVYAFLTPIRRATNMIRCEQQKPTKGTVGKKTRVRVHMWARGRVRSFGGMNRRKECVPCTLPSYRVQQTRLDVHCTLARVPTVCQNTADDNDNDTLGKGHRPDVRGPMLHGTGSVKAGNECPKAHTTATSAAAVSAWTKESKKNKLTSSSPQARRV